MRCGINAEPMFQRVPTGVGVYTLQLCRGLAEVDHSTEVVLFHADHASVPEEVKVLPMERGVFGLERDALYRSWREVRRPLPQSVCGHLDVIHAPGTAIPPRGSARLVATIHDLAPFRFPENYPREARVTFKRGALMAARHADLIICPSWSTAADVEALLDVEPARLRVVPHGADHAVESRPIREGELQRVLDRCGIPRPYVLWIGSQEPRKNVHAVLDAFAQLAPRFPDLTLVLHGPFGWLGAEVSEGLERRRIAGRTVVSEGSLSRRELTALYQGAAVFVYPSLYEGFGLPVVEAMACGTPVVAANQSAIRECVGDAGLLVEPLDHDGLAGAVAQVLSDDTLRKELSEAGRVRSAAFRWAETARRTWSVYEELAEAR